jgi:integrase
MLGGKRYRETFETEAQAEAYELECRAAVKLGKPIPSPRGDAARVSQAATIGGLVDYCAQHHWKGKKSEDTLVKNARMFADWVGPKVPVVQALTPVKVDAYTEWRASIKRNSNATLNRNLSAISVLLKFGKRLGFLSEVFELSWKREPVGRLRFYSPAEEQQLLLTLHQWGYFRERHLIELLADTGVRLGEAKKLSWGDIDGRRITLVDTKSGKNRTIVATDRALKAIEHMRADYIKTEGPFSWLNRHTLHKLWQRVVHHVGLSGDVTIHTWRHTCASRLVERGVDLYRVQKWMGHSAPTTTQRYAHLSPTAMVDVASVLNGTDVDMAIRDGFELMIPRH